MYRAKADGRRKHELYNTWNSMIQRCYNPNHKAYKYYGGRGVKVCDSWLSSFWNFVEDMGEKQEGYTLDRMDNDGNYEPSNCKWSTKSEQSRNTRNNILYELEGEVLIETDTAQALGISVKALIYRRKRNLSQKRLMTKGKLLGSKPVYLTVEGKTMHIAAWARETGQRDYNISRRKRRGWSDYECVYGRKKREQQ